MQDSPSNRFRDNGGATVTAVTAVAEAPARRAERSGIQVISRAAAILRALRDHPAGLSLAEISARVELPRSTVQRIVSALAAERLVMAASPSGRVRLGTEILALAVHSRVDVIEMVHPHLKALSEATGETVDLAVLRDDHITFVDQVAGSHRLRAASAIGDDFPLHSTANGKAGLALLDDAEIRERLAGADLGLASGRGYGIDALMDEIAEIRRTGLAYDEEAHSRGISAVGAAFRTAGGLIYAISIPTPTARFNDSRRELSERLRAANRVITEMLGG